MQRLRLVYPSHLTVLYAGTHRWQALTRPLQLRARRGVAGVPVRVEVNEGGPVLTGRSTNHRVALVALPQPPMPLAA